MHIVGHGFLAGQLARIADRHPDVLALAAGVSAATGTSPAQFARERALLDEAICRSTGERLLFFSTASTGMYGAPECQGREDEPVAPRTAYGCHKRDLELILAGSGVGHLCVRLAHVVGPDQPPHQLLPSLASQILAGQVRIHRGARRDIIDVADVVTVLDHLLALGTRDTVVNVATGYAVPVEAIVAHVQARLGVTAHRVEVDAPAVNHLVSIDTLRRLVPTVATLGFGERYYQRVLDRYVRPGVTV
jgi:NDP-hexose 4-ketoreductase